jgi:hypothetical protein
LWSLGHGYTLITAAILASMGKSYKTSRKVEELARLASAPKVLMRETGHLISTYSANPFPISVSNSLSE